MSTVVYISSYRGKVKDGSRYFNKITVACIVKDKPARVMDLFSKDGEKLAGQDELKFGDVLELDYVESDYPGGKPQLIGMKKTADSPY